MHHWRSPKSGSSVCIGMDVGKLYPVRASGAAENIQGARPSLPRKERLAPTTLTTHSSAIAPSGTGPIPVCYITAAPCLRRRVCCRCPLAQSARSLGGGGSLGLRAINSLSTTCLWWCTCSSQNVRDCYCRRWSLVISSQTPMSVKSWHTSRCLAKMCVITETPHFGCSSSDIQSQITPPCRNWLNLPPRR